MGEFIGHLISALFSSGTDLEVRATPHQCIRRALRISRRRRALTPEQVEFATAWLNHALGNLRELDLESKEVALRIALLKISHAKVASPTL